LYNPAALLRMRVNFFAFASEGVAVGAAVAFEDAEDGVAEGAVVELPPACDWFEAFVGTRVGAIDGGPVAFGVGIKVGYHVDAFVGARDGWRVGAKEGATVEWFDGADEGTTVDTFDGAFEGMKVGCCVDGLCVLLALGE
jgi:hypothetical protein